MWNTPWSQVNLFQVNSRGKKEEQDDGQYRMKKRIHHEVPEPSHPRPDGKKPMCLEKAKPGEDLIAIENEVPQIC